MTSNPSSTATTTTTTSPYGVSFAPFVKVDDVLHINDYSHEEIAACWFTPKEAELIELEIRNTQMIMAISAGQRIDCDSICTRGLEGVIEPAVDDVLDAVLDEQDIQFAQGVKDADKIAAICSSMTMESQALARILGCADQEWMLSNMAPQELLSVTHIVPTRAKRQEGIIRLPIVNPCRQRSFSSRAA